MAQTEFKPKNLLIDYEDIKEDVSYAFTFNPCDKYQHFKSSTRLSDFNKDLAVIFLYKCAEYIMYPEISKSGRLHLHGTIRIQDKNEFYIHCIPFLLNKGTVAIVKIENAPKNAKVFEYKTWHDYETKQKDFHKYYYLNTFQNIPIKLHDYD